RPRKVPRIAGDPVRGGLRGRAHGELVQVDLAQDHRARIAESARHGGIERRHVALQDSRCAGGGYSRGGDVVLEGDGNAVQRAQRIALAAPPVGFPRPSEGGLPRHVQEGAQTLVGRADPIEAGPSRLLRTQFARRQCVGELAKGEVRGIHSMILGATKKGPSLWGALATAFSTGSPGWTS